MAQKSFTAVCREFFGFKEGQTLTEFGAELKQLTHKDKLEIAEGLRAIGYDVAEVVEAK